MKTNYISNLVDLKSKRKKRQFTYNDFVNICLWTTILFATLVILFK